MYRELTKIKSEEEYKNLKKDLKYYISEYAWISSAKDPKKEVAERMRKLVDELEDEESKEKQFELLSEIHRLQIKYKAISTGEYMPVLKRNITATLVLIEQYESTKEHRTFWQNFSGIITGDKYTKNYFQRKYMISTANRNGAAPNAINLRLEKVEDILEYIAKNYNLVDTKIEEKNLSLVPVEEYKNPVRDRFNEMTDEFIAEQIDRDQLANSTEIPESKKDEIRKRKGKEHVKNITEPTRPKDEGRDI